MSITPPIWWCILLIVIVIKKPLQPPSYFTASRQPHHHGITLDEPPVCAQCKPLHTTIDHLQQHTKVLGSNDGPQGPPPGDGTYSHVSVYYPLSKHHNYASTDRLKTLPRWMELLPCNRNAHIKPPPPSALTRLLFRASNVDLLSTPYFTPPDFVSMQGKDMSIGSDIALDCSSTSSSTKELLPGEDMEPHVASSVDAKLDQPNGPGREGVETVEVQDIQRKNPFVRRYDMGSLQPRRRSARETPNQPSNTQTPLSSPEEPEIRASFFGELSNFLASRGKKLILPSRARERWMYP